MRILLVPRWAGGPDSDFYPWLEQQVAALAPERAINLQRLAMPEPQEPRVADWVDHLDAALGEDAASTILIGHSVGCQAVLRTLCARARGSSLLATLLVAPWRTVDEPWPSIRPWLAEPLDPAPARARAGRLKALLSDDDPFTRDWATTQSWLEVALGAEVKVISGARHFNGQQEPAVLEALLELVR